jgi:uroporphyrinogen-III synthase
VLVTRPVEQSDRLMQRLRALGARPLLFPALEIAAVRQPERLVLLLAGIERYDWLLFVSPTAVEYGLDALRQAGKAAAAMRINTAAVGSATAAALRAAGMVDRWSRRKPATIANICWRCRNLPICGRRVLIFRGEGGRELIAATLRDRGAQVDYAECYRRVCPDGDPRPLRQALADGRIQAVTAFSGETLDNLLSARRGRDATNPAGAAVVRAASAYRGAGPRARLRAAHADRVGRKRSPGRACGILPA